MCFALQEHLCTLCKNESAFEKLKWFIFVASKRTLSALNLKHLDIFVLVKNALNPSYFPIRRTLLSPLPQP